MCADRYELRPTIGGEEHKRLFIIRILYARCQVGNTRRGAKLETGAKTEHGRPDQNTNARKLSERKGSGGTVQIEMKTRELATKKHGPSRKIERRSTARVARQVWVQRAAHSKRVARKKPIPKNRKVKSGGHVRSCSCRQNEEIPKYVREYRPHGPTQRKKPEAYSSGTYMTSKKNKDGRGEDKKDSTPKTLERKAKKVL